MAVRNILKMGDCRLLQCSVEVDDPESAEITALIVDMRDTVLANNGAGLAAPQIGVNKRIIIIGVKNNPRYPRAAVIEETVVINPLIEVIDARQQLDWEACLSVPGMRGKVPRASKIRYTGLDPSGTPIDRTVDGFHARVIQHEVDHLDGLLYPMRMPNLTEFGYEDSLAGGGR